MAGQEFLGGLGGLPACTCVLYCVLLLLARLSSCTEPPSVLLGALGISLGPVGVQSEGAWFSSDNGGLSLISTVGPTPGSDDLGAYVIVEKKWRLGTRADAPRFSSSIRSYEGSFVVFRQTFVDSLLRTARNTSGDSVISSWPSLVVGDADDVQKQRGYLTWQGNFGCPGTGDGQRYCTSTGEWTRGAKIPGGTGGGAPLVVFDAGLSSSVVFSPLDHFLAGSHAAGDGDGLLHCGIQGGVDYVPAGTTYETVAVAVAGGVNEALEAWGSVLRRKHPAANARPLDQDVSAKYLSYYTDNGAFYYYNRGQASSYHEVLLSAWREAKKRSIPYRAYQLDSWWYFRDQINGGVVSWTPTREAFPWGIRNFTDQLGGVPIVAHNRYWSSNNWYSRENGGKYHFHLEDGGNALPDDPAFWPDLFAEAKKWGLAVYEQDWLDSSTDRVEGLRTSLDLGERWLRQMGMPYPRHLLAAFGIGAVTQIRASDDYQPGNSQWHVGDTSMLLHALRVAPFKDTFWTRQKQPGNPYGKEEPHTALQVLVATFSTGPVAPSDAAGATDVELLMRCCALDGRILAPSRPAVSLDSSFVRRALGQGRGPAGVVTAAVSFVSGLRFDHLLAAVLDAPFEVAPGGLPVPPAAGEGPRIAFTVRPGAAEWRPTWPLAPGGSAAALNGMEVEVQPFSDAAPIVVGPCNETSPQVWHSTPLLAGGTKIALLGELNKMVPLSPARVLAVRVLPSPAALEVEVQGSPGEVVPLIFLAGVTEGEGGGGLLDGRGKRGGVLRFPGAAGRRIMRGGGVRGTLPLHGDSGSESEGGGRNGEALGLVLVECVLGESGRAMARVPAGGVGGTCTAPLAAS